MVLWPIRVLFELFYKGISSPEKSCNNTREKIRYFFTCVWYRQSAADTSHAFRATRSGWWMNGKAFTILNPRSFVRIFSDYFCLKTEIFVSTLTDSDVQTFLEREENQKKKRKEKPKVTYLVVLVMAFLAAENENRPLEDLPQADFGRVPEWFLLSVRTNSITKNFVHGKLGPLFVFVVIQRMFSSWVRQRTLRFVFGDCRSFYFHSLIESTFLVSKRLLCLHDKQNNT